MFNLDKFISDSVTFRSVSMFAPDIEANKEKLTAEIKGKKVCVIGGAGSIGSSSSKRYFGLNQHQWLWLISMRMVWQNWCAMYALPTGFMCQMSSVVIR